jgi:hypothetical protein
MSQCHEFLFEISLRLVLAGYSPSPSVFKEKAMRENQYPTRLGIY